MEPFWPLDKHRSVVRPQARPRAQADERVATALPRFIEKSRFAAAPTVLLAGDPLPDLGEHLIR